MHRFIPAEEQFAAKYPPTASRAFAYQALGRLPEALADFDRALELQPEFARTYRDRAKVRSALGDDDGAVADHEEASRRGE